MRRPTLSRAPVVRLSSLLVALAVIALPLVAAANPGKVGEILRQSGTSGVVRGPKTIDNKTKSELANLARQAAERTGGKVFVVIVNKSTNTQPYAKLYDTLGLGGKDVLIATNGPRWELRCNGISKADKRRLMKSVMSSTGAPKVRLTALLSELPKALNHSQAKAKRPTGTRSGTRSGTRPARQPMDAVLAPTVEESSGGFPWTAVFFLLFVAGGVGFVIFRRKQRDGALDAEFKAAIDPAENYMADFYLGTDGFESHPQFSAMLAKGTEISTEIDALKAKTPTREAVAKAAALAKRAAAVESELRRLT